MKKEMTLKEFIESLMEEPFSIKKFGHQTNLLEKMIQIESIENYMNAMYGVELDIKVKPIKKKEGRFYGHSLVDSLSS